MLVFNLMAAGIALALIYTGILNNQEGPIYLGILIMLFVCLIAAWKAVEDYLVSKIDDWV